nr:Vacuolar protein sorting-associated protein 35 [Polyrhizophydium stewartii]
MGYEEMCYEFFVQALTVYEECVSESRAQVSAITQIIGTLYTTIVFGYENYETLITKCAVHCSRLLKRVDQCRGVTLVSHLFWAEDPAISGSGAAGAGATAGASAAAGVGGGSGSAGGAAVVAREEGKPAYRDGKRVLECLQKALKIADSVMDQSVNVELFIEILERYVWYFEQKNEMITIKFINSLLELIHTNLVTTDSMLGSGTGGMASPLGSGAAYAVSGGPLSASTPATSIFSRDAGGAAAAGSGGGGGGAGSRGRRVSPLAVAHFGNIVAHLVARRDEELRALDSSRVVPGMSAGFAAAAGGGGRWGGLVIPRM